LRKLRSTWGLDCASQEEEKEFGELQNEMEENGEGKIVRKNNKSRGSRT
jgi:hypothetical protein